MLHTVWQHTAFKASILWAIDYGKMILVQFHRKKDSTVQNIFSKIFGSKLFGFKFGMS